MPKKVRLEKIGTMTRVTEYFTENPLQEKIFNIPDAVLYSEKENIVVDLVKYQLSFTISELEDNFGSDTVQELMNQLAVRKYFICDVEDNIGSLNYVVTENTERVQSDELIGKESIDLVFVANSPNQNISNYNTVTGAFDFTATAGEKLLIFYTN
jgi:hypothetical protein